jgi:hypothetical protein
MNTREGGMMFGLFYWPLIIRPANLSVWRDDFLCCRRWWILVPAVATTRTRGPAVATTRTRGPAVATIRTRGPAVATTRTRGPSSGNNQCLGVQQPSLLRQQNIQALQTYFRVCTPEKLNFLWSHRSCYVLVTLRDSFCELLKNFFIYYRQSILTEFCSFCVSSTCVHCDLTMFFLCKLTKKIIWYYSFIYLLVEKRNNFISLCPLNSVQRYVIPGTKLRQRVKTPCLWF